MFIFSTVDICQRKKFDILSLLDRLSIVVDKEVEPTLRPMERG